MTLATLESISRGCSDRLLRLQGLLPGPEGPEPFELLIYRGISSSLTHPTAFDPDQPALPDGALVEAVTLLRAPLHPGAPEVLAGPAPLEQFLTPGGWRV